MQQREGDGGDEWIDASELEEVVGADGSDVPIIEDSDDEAQDNDDEVEGSGFRVVFEEVPNSGDDEPEVDMSYCCFSGHRDSVYCAAIHPFRAGVVITGGGDDTAFIWKYAGSAANSSMMIVDEEELAGGQVVNCIELSGHTDTVISVGFNFNGTMALTGSYDGTVRVWNAETGALQRILDGPEDVEWAQWHGRGNAIIAGSRDGTAWMWLSHNGQCVHVFAGHEGGVSAGCFTSDGKSICTCGEDGTVRHWNPKSGVCRHVFSGGIGHDDMVTCVDSGGDGDMIVTGSADGTVKVFKLSGKKLLHTFIHSETQIQQATEYAGGEGGDNHVGDEIADDDRLHETTSVMGVECVGFSSTDFRYVASGGMDKALKVWDTTTGTLRSTCIHGGSVSSLKWHSRLPVICSAAVDNILRLWDARSGALLLELTGHTNMILSLDMRPLLDMISASCEGEVSTSPGDITTGMVEVNHATDAIVSVSDDNTARVFLINMDALIQG